MRLFIAINFCDNVKECLVSAQEELRKQAIKGNYTLKDNLHLTLVFLGEVVGNDIDEVKKAMDAAADSTAAIDIRLDGVGNFKRERGDIWWIWVSPRQEVTKLQSRITEKLSSYGIKHDDKPFSPHLTIAREIISDAGFDKDSVSKKVPTIPVAVDKISLMKSERMGGKLTYTEIYARCLR